MIKIIHAASKTVFQFSSLAACKDFFASSVKTKYQAQNLTLAETPTQVIASAGEWMQFFNMTKKTVGKKFT